MLIVLAAENINGPDDRWAFTVYNTLRNAHESIVVKQEDIDVLHSCLTPVFQNYPVIVRKEYGLIWEHIVAARAREDHCRGLVVYGQPGIGMILVVPQRCSTHPLEIGKSLFLLYALARAIQAHIPVALCDSPENYYLFDDEGVSCQTYDLPRPPHVLALFDTVPGLEYPKTPFVGNRSDSFIVHATSPKVSRWKMWSKLMNAQMWVMELWNETEIESMRYNRYFCCLCW